MEDLVRALQRDDLRAVFALVGSPAPAGGSAGQAAAWEAMQSLAVQLAADGVLPEDIDTDDVASFGDARPEVAEPALRAGDQLSAAIAESDSTDPSEQRRVELWYIAAVFCYSAAVAAACPLTWVNDASAACDPAVRLSFAGRAAARRAELHLAQGKKASAAKDAVLAVALAPRVVDAHVLAARVLLAAGEEAAAKAVVALARRRHPKPRDPAAAAELASLESDVAPPAVGIALRIGDDNGEFEVAIARLSAAELRRSAEAAASGAPGALMAPHLAECGVQLIAVDATAGRAVELQGWRDSSDAKAATHPGLAVDRATAKTNAETMESVFGTDVMQTASVVALFRVDGRPLGLAEVAALRDIAAMPQPPRTRAELVEWQLSYNASLQGDRMALAVELVQLTAAEQRAWDESSA